jgi:hypothetical protein
VEKGDRGGAHWRRGGQRGTEEMLSAAACFGASGWMRRQGGVGQGLSLAQEGGEIGRERKRGCRGGDVRFNGDRRCRLKEGGSLGWHHTVRRWGRGMGPARRLGGNGPRPAGAGGTACTCDAVGAGDGG